MPVELSPMEAVPQAGAAEAAALALSGGGAGGKANRSRKGRVDKSEVFKYVIATVGQFGFMALFLAVLDRTSLVFARRSVVTLFALLSIRSRVFSFLDSRRPRKPPATAADVLSPKKQRRLRWPQWMPKWLMRPKWVWLIWTAITLLRGYSSALVFESAGNKLFSAPLLAFVAHLAIGDTWYTTSNLEKRLGVSTVACLVVFASVIVSTKMYYDTIPLAGMLLAPSAAWISVACAISLDMWRINYPRQSLAPRVNDGKGIKWGIEYSLLGWFMPLVDFLAKAPSSLFGAGSKGKNQK